MELPHEKRTPQQMANDACAIAAAKAQRVGGIVNPFKILGIRRNHSCPCGSGKRFKSCCRTKGRG